MPGKYKPVLHPHQYPPKVQRTCAQCGTEFAVTPSVVRKSEGKYCSDTCRQLAYQSHRKECVCPRCGKTFWRVASAPGVYCSRACQCPPAIVLFWPKVDKSGHCWLWTEGTNKAGYGLFGPGVEIGGSALAHRVAWELVAGPVPDDLFVLHTCDNPACVRNDDAGWYEVNGVLRPRRGHLFLGTRGENNKDKVVKGRSARGETAGHAKLTDAQVVEIRTRHALGNLTYPQLAPDYGVSEGTIGSVVRRHTWKHLP